jgi:hypothetical protein
MRLAYQHWRDALPDGRWLWEPEFMPREFRCAHCDRLEIETAFMKRLFGLRMDYGKPIQVISGYRCEQHPAERKKNHQTPGPHPLARAVDPGIDPADLGQFMRLARLHGFTRFGLRYTASQGFQIHLDDLTAADGFAVRHDGELFMWSYDR